MSATPVYSFRASARWTTGRSGVAETQPAAPPIDFAAPPEFQGESGFWTPEHFLVAAVASCFITSFRAIAEFARFEPEALEVRAEGTVEKTEKGYRFTRVVVRPALTVRAEEKQGLAKRLLEKTEHACLVSHSLLSELQFEPTIQVASAVGNERGGE